MAGFVASMFRPLMCLNIHTHGILSRKNLTPGSMVREEWVTLLFSLPFSNTEDHRGYPPLAAVTEFNAMSARLCFLFVVGE